MLGFGVSERIANGDCPLGGITSRVVLPSMTSNGIGSKLSKKCTWSLYNRTW